MGQTENNNGWGGGGGVAYKLKLIFGLVSTGGFVSRNDLCGQFCEAPAVAAVLLIVIHDSLRPMLHKPARTPTCSNSTREAHRKRRRGGHSQA